MDQVYLNPGVITDEPQFLSTDPDDPQFMILDSISPCINTGTTESFHPDIPVPFHDIRGKARPFLGAFDMGANEYYSVFSQFSYPNEDVKFFDRDSTDPIALSWEAFDEKFGIKENSITIEYSLDGGANWQIVVQNYPNTGNYPWVFPKRMTRDGLLMLTATNNNIPPESFTTYSVPFRMVSYIPYVSLTGNDGNTGLASSPFKTIQQALN